MTVDDEAQSSNARRKGKCVPYLVAYYVIALGEMSSDALDTSIEVELVNAVEVLYFSLGAG